VPKWVELANAELPIAARESGCLGGTEGHTHGVVSDPLTSA
jgi:hypothetical protein